MPRRYFVSHIGGSSQGTGGDKRHVVRNIKSRRNMKKAVRDLRASGYSVHKVWRG